MHVVIEIRRARNNSLVVLNIIDVLLEFGDGV